MLMFIVFLQVVFILILIFLIPLRNNNLDRIEYENDYLRKRLSECELSHSNK